MHSPSSLKPADSFSLPVRPVRPNRPSTNTAEKIRDVEDNIPPIYQIRTPTRASPA